MSSTDAWLESLVENYKIPKSESKRGILKESQLKNILNDGETRKPQKEDARRTTVRTKK